MLDNFKFACGILFFSLIFTNYSASAQTLDTKNAVQTSAEKSDSQKDSSTKDNSRSEENLSTTKEDAEERPEVPDYTLRRGDKEINIEYGVSPFNPSNFAGPKEFDVYGRDLHLVTVRFGRIIGTKKNVSYEYMFGVTPLVAFSKNEVHNDNYISATETPNEPKTIRKTTYAVAIQPVNFKFMFLAKKRLKPYVQVGAGLLYAQKPVPVPYSRRFNLTGDFGGGLMYMLSENRTVSLGYKYFHISNGNIGGKINNPGFNANVFYLNYSFFWKR
jgi:opacity protein-like surface antigen